MTTTASPRLRHGAIAADRRRHHAGSSPAERTPGWAHVTYISGPAIYLDVGTKGGLREGARLEVVRGNTVIAELAVAYVSSSRSSCTVVTQTAPVAIGDSARFTPRGSARRGRPPKLAARGR